MKANKELAAFARVKKYLGTDYTRILFKGFIESQFKYYPLSWLFCSRSNQLHERVLPLLYNDCDLPFDRFLEKDESFTVYNYNS